MRTSTLLCLALVVLALQPTWAQDVAQPAVVVAPAELTEGENLILNPSFEEEMAAWQVAQLGRGLEVARDDSCSSEGDWSLRLTSRTGQSVDVALFEGAVEPGARYRFAVKYATSTEGTDADYAPAPLVWVTFTGDRGAAADLNWMGSEEAIDWTPQEAEVTVPPDASVMSLRLFLHQQAGTIWFDEARLVQLRQGEEPAKLAPDGNILCNGDMEHGAAGQPDAWCPDTGRVGIHRQWVKYEQQGRHVWSDTNPHSGERCLCCEVLDNGKVPYICWLQYVALRPNTTYRLSGWLRAEGATAVNMHVVASEARGLSREIWETTYVGAGPWQEKATTFTTPAWDGGCRPGYVGMLAGKVGKAYADDLRLEEVATELIGVEVAVESDKPGNVFATADEACFRVKLTNTTDANLAVSGRYAAVKSGGRPEWREFTGSVTLPPRECQEFRIGRAASEPGVYTLHVAVAAADGRAVTQKVPFAVGG